MDAILFSANPTMVKVDDGIRHLSDHDELYWEVGFWVASDKFSYPMLGFIHICGGQVEYKVDIQDIIPFSAKHYEDKDLASRVKPDPWLKEWERNENDTSLCPWKTAIVMTSIEPFSYNTYNLKKYDGSPVKRPPQNYIRVLPPGEGSPKGVSPGSRIKEQNLEEFVAPQIEEIEYGLQLVKRQLSTPAGRLDFLCQDREGQYVVVELKRAQGTDQVVGQILRYMGWVLENYRTDKVRGIIVVGKKDRALSYAVRAVPNVQVKEFHFFIK